MARVDLNCDLGESFGSYTLGMDTEVIPLISSCNIACGYHASDPIVMDRTVKLAASAGIGIGAHPGFPDLMGFGRRNMAVTPAEAAAYLTYQIGALSAFATANGKKLQHVKPHGALYNMAAVSYDMSLAMAKAVQAIDPSLIFLALAGSETVRACREIGQPVAQEVFADRGYQADGTLVPRRQPGAVITDEDEAAARVVRMVVEHRVTAITGEDIEIIPDSICVHGDGVKALEFVRRIRADLSARGVEIVPLAAL